ncbi:MAG TPA: hypothetical protein VF848_11980 [Steroidobacteraceae bacterium]
MLTTQPGTQRPTEGIIKAAVRYYRAALLDCLPWSLVLTLLTAAIWHLLAAGIGPLYRAIENRVQVILLSEDSSELLNYLTQAQEQSQSLLASADILKAQAQAYAFFSGASFWLPCALYCLASIGCWNMLLLRINTAAGMARPRVAEILLMSLRRIPGALALLLLIILISSTDFLPSTANGGLFMLWLIVQVALTSYVAGILLLAWVPTVVEPNGVWAAIRKSQQLLKGHWWRAITILSTVILVPLLAALIAAVLGGTLLGAVGVSDYARSAGQLLAGLAALVILRPFVPAVFVAMYQELWQIKTQGAPRR